MPPDSLTPYRDRPLVPIAAVQPAAVALHRHRLARTKDGDADADLREVDVSLETHAVAETPPTGSSVPRARSARTSRRPLHTGPVPGVFGSASWAARSSR